MFKHSIFGGTFDHLHIGHKKFIDAAFERSEKITIGLATEKLFADKKFPYIIQDYDVRKQTLEDYLSEKKYSDRAIIIPLNDIFGNALSSDEIDALFVTETVFANGQKINEEREKKGLLSLELVVVAEVEAEDGTLISSTRIRSGEMDRDGKLYEKLFTFDLALPDSLRETLAKPFGEMMESSKIKDLETNFLITIGDIVTSEFVKNEKQANLSIYDLKTKREKVADEIIKLLPEADDRIENQHGTISSYAVEVLVLNIQNALQSSTKRAIEIVGEEDLLALPAILLAPLGSTLVYGLKDQGMVEIEVTEEKKSEIKKLIEKFDHPGNK